MKGRLSAHPLPGDAFGRLEIAIDRSDIRATEVADLIAVLEEAWVFVAEDDTARLQLERAEEGSLTLWLLLMVGANAGVLPSYMTYVSFVALLPEVAKLPKAINEVSDAIQNVKKLGRWLKKRVVRVVGTREARAEEIRKDIDSVLDRIAAGTSLELKLTQADGYVEERRYRYPAEVGGQTLSGNQPAQRIDPGPTASAPAPPPAPPTTTETNEAEAKRMQVGRGAAEP